MLWQLDLQSGDLTLQPVDVDRLGLDLHLDAAAGLVDEIDGLVRQRAVGDVAIREHRGRHAGGVGDLDAVVGLVLLLDAAEDGDGVLDVGSSTSTGWKRRSSALSFSRCLRYSSSVVAPMARSWPRASAGFSMLPASIEPSVLPAPTRVWSSSMNRMTCARRGLDLVEDGLEALLELAAVLGTREQRRQVQRQDLLALQTVGHVAGGDALRDALDDGGLADPGVSDEDGVVLGPPRQHLQRAADLLVAADDGVELSVGGLLGHVDRVLVECLVLGLGVFAGDLLAAAHRARWR